MTIEDGNILDKTHGIICHQVNSEGVMGAGLALSIKNKYPVVYKEYMEVYNTGQWRTGRVSYTEVADGLFVANLCAQGMYGYGGRFTDYEALEQCIESVKGFAPELPIYFPYGIGCGLAGGDWEIVSEMIEKIIPDATIVRIIN